MVSKRHSNNTATMETPISMHHSYAPGLASLHAPAFLSSIFLVRGVLVEVLASDSRFTNLVND